jgi:hypothetical protein
MKEVHAMDFLSVCLSCALLRLSRYCTPTLLVRYFWCLCVPYFFRFLCGPCRIKECYGITLHVCACRLVSSARFGAYPSL